MYYTLHVDYAVAGTQEHIQQPICPVFSCMSFQIALFNVIVLTSHRSTAPTFQQGHSPKGQSCNMKHPAAQRSLLKKLRLQGIGEMGVNIFLREAQLVWEEAFPFADKRTLDMAKDKGLPSKNAKELAEHCGNDR